MKLEIVKETKINGDVFYSIEVDGKYLADSTSAELSKVNAMHDRIVQSGSVTGTIKEVLKTTEL